MGALARRPTPIHTHTHTHTHIYMNIIPNAPISHRSEGHKEGLYQNLHFYNNKSMLFYFISYLGAMGQRPISKLHLYKYFVGGSNLHHVQRVLKKSPVPKIAFVQQQINVILPYFLFGGLGTTPPPKNTLTLRFCTGLLS